jgi:hypothetical protein
LLKETDLILRVIGMPTSANLPDVDSTTGPGGQVISVGPQVKVACFGDSLMWGQGLKNEQKFKTLIAHALRGQLGKTVGIVYDRSRSGAKITGSPKDRAEFVETYPELFPGGKGLDAFKVNGKEGGIFGEDESPASALFGEVPSTYPTVAAQVELMSDTQGKTIDYVLLDGGINDIEPEVIINPQEHDGAYIENYDRPIRDIGLDNVLALIKRVRSKCPKAVILYFGFFPGLSYESSESMIREFMKHEYGDDVAWWFNEHIYHVEDIDRLINQGQTRALWFYGRWMYWTRQAIAAANGDDAIRGPGILYVPSGFGEGNAAFASRSFLWQDYEEPTVDPARTERLAKIPRNKQHDTMIRLFLLRILNNDDDAKRTAKELLAALEADKAGPGALMRELRAYVTGTAGAGGLLDDELRKEIHLIQHGRIASLAHPNPSGALTYAGLAMERFKRHRETLDRIAREAKATHSPPTPGSPTLDSELRRYNMRTNRSLQADAGHLEVDSLCLRVTTAADSDRNLAPPVSLVVHTKSAGGFTSVRTYLLTFRPYQLDSPLVALPAIKAYPYFEPGVQNRLTAAVDGDLLLTDIAGVSVVLGANPYKGTDVSSKLYGTTWRPEAVALEVNGREVVRRTPFGQKFGPGQSLDLGWPAPAPPFKPPQIFVPIQQKVGPLPKELVAQMEARVNRARAADAPSPAPPAGT